MIQDPNGIFRKLFRSDAPVPTPAEMVQTRVDTANAEKGNLNEKDGYNCDLCMNRGFFEKVKEENGRFYESRIDCVCMKARKSIRLMRKSGLNDVIRECTFEKWDSSENWQRNIKEIALTFVEDCQGWFFIGGQSGSGKTRICTTICRSFLLAQKEVVYMQWREESSKLKFSGNDHEKSSEQLKRFKTAEVLYIDDLFKCGKNQDGSMQRPTSADIGLAFEILNYRYNKPELLTIISSELTTAELLEIDEAIGSRIYDRAKSINIQRSRTKNYRLKNTVEL